jgi:hypothetical protein
MTSSFLLFANSTDAFVIETSSVSQFARSLNSAPMRLRRVFTVLYMDLTLRAIVERMNAIKRTEGIEEKTLRQYLSFAVLFAMLTGLDDLPKFANRT